MSAFLETGGKKGYRSELIGMDLSNCERLVRGLMNINNAGNEHDMTMLSSQYG
jgi:hypothetical protein